MNTPTSNDLLEAYNLGWMQEYSISTLVLSPTIYENDLLQKAYNIGRQDYKHGDDIKELDYQTNEQILKKIKK